MAALLAAVAGFLDALNLVELTGTFVANQTGNTVLVGIALADGNLGESWPAAAAVVSFVLGGKLAAQMAARLAGAVRWPLLVSEAALLVAFALVAVLGAEDSAGRATGPTLAALVVLGAAAMGIQASAVLHVHGEPVSTTFTSGMLHDAGRLAAELASRRVDHVSRLRGGFVVLSVAVLVYAGGAAVGALAAKGGRIWLFVPAAVVSLLAADELLRTRRAAPARIAGR
jgi:uncharacterized membrane protein YoaK (UPF0700 family)